MMRILPRQSNDRNVIYLLAWDLQKLLKRPWNFKKFSFKPKIFILPKNTAVKRYTVFISLPGHCEVFSIFTYGSTLHIAIGIDIKRY